jgi:hypothetical protein
MNRRHFLTLAALLPLAACSSEEQWNQRLTVIVDSPAGEIRGSAVTQITKTDTTGGIFFPPEARRVNSAVVGEAVAVEVTPGRWLFALLGGREDGKGEAASWVYPAFIEPAEPDQRKRSYARAMQIVRAQPLDTPAPLPLTDLPMFVTFDDLTRPETVRLVDPSDLAASFGPGVTLRVVTLEVTDEAVTEGHIDSLMNWLGPFPEPHLVPGDGRTTNIPFAMRVAHGDFVRRP